MRRITCLIGICSVLLAVLVACGPQNTVNKAPVRERLYVLDNATPGTNDYTHIIAFHPDNSASAMTLPAGLFSQDHQRIYSAAPQGTQTTITITNAQTGSTLHSFTSIALSSDGRTLYAVHPQSGITLIDVGSGQSTQVTQSPAHHPWGVVWVAG